MEALFLKTLDELLEHDKQRETDGFPRRIRLGRLSKPLPGKKSQVVVVPTTTEPKFYHDDSVTEDGEGGETGGSGEGQEGEVLGESPAEPQEGEGQGPGQGEGGDHDLTSDAYDLGKVLTERFQLPNIKDKGKKRSFNKYTYDLTDRNRGFGQLLDKKATMRRIVETNIQLGNITPGLPINTDELMVGPRDQVYRILSPEKDFETQAVVFFVRDYSGSMEGRPTELVSLQHLLIYSWLAFQYQNNIISRFILHDTEAKEVPDFYTYYKSSVSGGTRCAPAFEMVNKIIDDEHLAVDYNIYVFYGTDGDDWDNAGKELTEALEKMTETVNRIGITVTKSTEGSDTVVERTVERSGLLKTKPKLIRLDSFAAADANEQRLIDGIKKLVG
ncbi:MAG TPA: DUF444 family protein [bacterium]|nr:DUF444 family protein [bacterium]